MNTTPPECTENISPQFVPPERSTASQILGSHPPRACEHVCCPRSTIATRSNFCMGFRSERANNNRQAIHQGPARRPLGGLCHAPAGSNTFQKCPWDKLPKDPQPLIRPAVRRRRGRHSRRTPPMPLYLPLFPRPDICHVMAPTEATDDANAPGGGHGPA